MTECLLYETMLSKLGSRMTLTLQPGKRKSRCGALGYYYDNDVNLTIAARCGDETRVLPFGDRLPASKTFERIDQSISMCSSEYVCNSEGLPYDLRVRVVAPFYPGDAKLSTAPFLYLVFKVTSRASTPVSGSVLLASDNPYQHGGFFNGTKAFSKLYREDGLLGFTLEGLGVDDAKLMFAGLDADTTYQVQDHTGQLADHFAKHGRLPDKIELDRPVYAHASGLCWEFDLQPGESREHVFALVGYHNSHALKVTGGYRRFKYTELFPDAESVVRYAMESYPDAMRKVSLFEDTLGKSWLPTDVKDLTAYAIQSYIANTWWVEDDWFTVWEGRCRFHSTIDVAYNSELFTLQYWPELLKMQLDEWTRFRIGSYLAHDIGDDRVIFGQSYSADMPVEECTNYLLLLYAYWKATGDSGKVAENAGLAREFVDYIVSTDTDGDGVPDDPVAVNNTVDDASPVTKGAPCQTYLAVKTLASYAALQEMYGLELSGEIDKINRTLSEKLWSDDRYLLCAGVAGSCSIYSGNGLLYHLISGADIPVDLTRFRKDIEATTPDLMRAYGCTHSSLDRTTWISQNIWRDLVGMYLGLDMMENAARYWSFQRERNTWDTGCFTDTYHYGTHATDLDRYPRGAIGAGYFLAVAGLTVDKPAGRLRIEPKYDRVRVPVLFAADWENERIPWLEWTVEGDVAQLHLDECPGFTRVDLALPAEVQRVCLMHLGISVELSVGSEREIQGILFVVTKGEPRHPDDQVAALRRQDGWQRRLQHDHQ
ncbi:MAG: GH116 family glycosyl-hydrolase [Armatimonadetes bacterium]|nr:GH116 family glycosyl-hydrolase [Armatimonadota bacterium]